MAQKDYIPGSALAGLLDPVKLMQASSMMRSQDLQQSYLTLAEDRAKTSAVSALLNAYKTGYENTEGVLDDLYKIDTTGSALASYVTSDTGKDMISQYPHLAPYIDWGKNYKQNQETMSNIVNNIMTDTKLNDVDRFTKFDSLKSVYPDMGKFKSQYDTLHSQFKTASDKSVVNTFLNSAEKSGVFPAQKIMRIRATNVIDPKEALKEINEYDATKRIDTLLQQWVDASAIATNPLTAHLNKPAVDAAKKSMGFVEEELKALGHDIGGTSADGTSTSGNLSDKALLSVKATSPSEWFELDVDGNIVNIPEEHKAKVEAAMSDWYKQNQPTDEKDLEPRFAAAREQGVILPGMPEWEAKYDPDSKEPRVAVAEATLRDTTKTTPPPITTVKPVSGDAVYDASIGKWLTLEGEPATYGQIQAAKGKGKQAVRLPAKLKVEKPVVKKELPPAKPGEPGRMPSLKFMRFNNTGVPVFSTPGEPTGTTFPKELQQYRGGYTTEEQNRFRDISGKLKSDRKIYEKIFLELDKIQKLETKKKELDSSRSGYEKALQYYEGQIESKTKKKIDPLKLQLAVPEFYDQVIAGFKQ